MSFDLKKSLPKPATRFVLPPVHGSADAYVLAQAAAELKSQKRMLTVVVANASDAQRLLAEIPWFGKEASDLRCHLLPDWETLPYDAFSPHQDLVSERLATLYEVLNWSLRCADRTSHHCAGTHGTARLPRFLYLLLQTGRNPG